MDESVDRDRLDRLTRSSTGSRNLVSISAIGWCVARYVLYSCTSDRDGEGKSRVDVKEDRT